MPNTLALQLICHAVGDYLFQSDWMANKKTSNWLPAILHATTYTAAFLLLTTSWAALLIIGGTHALIDRYRLVRYLIWAKNFLAPPQEEEWDQPREEGALPKVTTWWHPWSECSGTGYHKDKPPWMTVWLMIITDNLLHVIINAVALYYLGDLT
jgi:hypothetical protein